jgi:penicillin-binding protein activator
MSRLLNCLKIMLVTASVFALGAGCASVKEVNVATAKPLVASYDYSDLHWLGNSIGSELAAAPLLSQAPKKPILVVMGIQNRTSEHIDTKAITDTIRTVVINSGKASFVNESQRDALLKEQGYQLANCTPETRAQIGRQLGAKYMLTGSIIEIRNEQQKQVRVSKKEEIFYQLTVEVTDLESSLIAWTQQRERARSATRPIIGW